jgi:hypothetical protein
MRLARNTAGRETCISVAISVAVMYVSLKRTWAGFGAVDMNLEGSWAV